MSASRTHTFVFSALGTMGDVAPLFTLASALVKRGHTCHLLANDWLAAEARRQGIEYTSIGRAQTNNVTALEQCLQDHVFPSFEPTRLFFTRNRSALRNALVISTDAHSASNVLAEAQGLATARVYVAPFKLRSESLPDESLRARCSGPLGYTFAKYGLKRVYALWDRFPLLLRQLNELRASVGLDAVDSVRHSDRLIRRHLALFPDWFCPRPADWPEELVLAGFPVSPPSADLPRELEAFLSGRLAPLVFTPGTGVEDVQPFFREAEHCCRELRRPGIFLSRQLAAWDHAQGPDIATFPYLSLSALLPRAALLTHHGGIGTTAQALAAGVPQIVSPQVYDQPDNAGHVAALGAGKVLARAAFSGAALAQAARELLSCEATRQRLNTLARRIADTDAVQRCVELLELEASQEASAAQTRARPGATGLARVSPPQTCLAGPAHGEPAPASSDEATLNP